MSRWGLVKARQGCVCVWGGGDLGGCKGLRFPMSEGAWRGGGGPNVVPLACEGGVRKGTAPEAPPGFQPLGTYGCFKDQQCACKVLNMCKAHQYIVR